MKRVRYAKDSNGSLVTTVETSTGGVLTARLTNQNNGVVGYTVTNGTGQVVATGVDMTLAGAKRQVRAQLFVLGVSLGQETRKRGGKIVGTTEQGSGLVGQDGQTTDLKSGLFS